MNVFTLRELSSTFLYLHFWLNGLFGTIGISRFFSVFLCNFYSYLTFLSRESQFHIVLSPSKFKVLLIIV